MILLAIATGIAGVAGLVLLHSLVRTMPRFRTGLSMVFGLAIVAYSLTAVFFIQFSEAEPIALCSISSAVFLLGFMLYLHFYGGIIRSVSVRMLIELLEAPDRALSVEALDQRYSGRTMLHTRLEAMIDNGYLTQADNRYTCLPKARRFVRIALFLKRLFRMERTG